MELEAFGTQIQNLAVFPPGIIPLKNKILTSARMRFPSLPSLPLHIICLGIACTVNGQTWDRTSQQTTADPKKPNVDVVFEFRPAATGELPEFQDLEPGITARWENAASQAVGRQVRFSIPIGVFSGTQTIILPYKLGKEGTAGALKAEITIPEFSEVSPRVLVWRLGEEGPKSAVITSVTPEGIQYEKVVSVNKAFAAEIKNKAPHIYEITVTPVSPVTRGRYVVRVFGKSEAASKTGFNLYLEVR